MDCLGTKKTRWQKNPSSKMLASIEDHVIQGTKAIWWRSPFSWPCAGERTKGKKPPQDWKLLWKSLFSKQQPTRNKDKTKRNLDSRTSQMLLICLLHVTGQGLSPGSRAALSTVAAGTGQWLELLGGLGLLLSRRCQAEEGGRGSPGSTPSPLQLSAAGGWSDRMEQGLVWFSHCGAMAGQPRWQQWKRKEKRSDEKERKSSLAQRPKQRGASALHCLSFSEASRNEREACVSVVSF